MTTETTSKPATARKSRKAAASALGSPVSGVKTMRHLVNSDGTKGGNVILDGHNFGPASEKICKLIDNHRAAIGRKATVDEEKECRRAEAVDSLAADAILAYNPRTKAELVEKVRYIWQAEIHCNRLPNLDEKALSALLKSWDIFARPVPSSIDEAISNHKVANEVLSATEDLPDESPLYADEYIALDRLIDIRPKDLSEAHRKVSYLLSIDKGARIGLNDGNTLIIDLFKSLMPDAA